MAICIGWKKRCSYHSLHRAKSPRWLCPVQGSVSSPYLPYEKLVEWLCISLPRKKIRNPLPQGALASRWGEFNQGLIKRAGEIHSKVPLVETPLISSLTPRENEIGTWVLKGLTNNEIGTHLYISEITVKKHLSSIYEKLGVKGKAQLVKKIISLDEQG